MGKTGQRLSLLEQGDAIPQLEELVRLHHSLVHGEADQRGASLLAWLGSWVEQQRNHERAKHGRAKNALSPEHDAELDAALGLLRRVLPPSTSGAPSTALTLAAFPDAFLPLQIIVGDRRETSERDADRADLFALDVSSTDVMFLGDLLLKHPSFLNAPPALWSDKTLLKMEGDSEYLEAHFGHSNLLVIGSPAVNWAARMINPGAIFRFDIDDDWQDWDQRYRGESALADGPTFRLFWRIVREVEDAAAEGRELADGDGLLADEDGLRAKVDPRAEEQEAFKAARKAATRVLTVQGAVQRPSAITPKFRKYGFVDLVHRDVQGLYTRTNNDFGVVSLAPNPFAADGSRHVAILVGGIHGPGTALAVKFLADPTNFSHHAFGGVIEVKLPPGDGVAWPNRFRHAKPEWETKGYEPEALLDRLTSAVEVGGGSRGGRGDSDSDAWFRGQYKREELSALHRFVARLTGDEGGSKGA